MACSRRLRTLGLGLAAIAIACSSSSGSAPDASTDGATADASFDSTTDGATADTAPGDDASDAPTDVTQRDAASGDAPTDGSGLDVVVDASDFFDVAGDDGGACNGTVNLGLDVQQVDVDTARPAATGGSLVDGTYVKIRDVEYTGPGGATGPTGYLVKETLTIVNSSTGTALLDSVFTDNVGTTTERIAFSPTTGGGATTLTFVCPAFGPSPTFYNVHTGDAGQLELDIYISTTRIETFTRQ